MESLDLNGVRYVKARKIARELGYTSDYVGQLCRAGKIDAQLVGRSWYVAEQDLRNHRAAAKRGSMEYQKRAISEMRDNENRKKNYLRDYSPFQYESDESELLPAVQKEVATIEVHLANATDVPVTQVEPAFVVEATESETPPLKGRLEIQSIDESDGSSVDDVVPETLVDDSEELEKSNAAPARSVATKPRVTGTQSLPVKPIRTHQIRSQRVSVSYAQTPRIQWEYISIAVAASCLLVALSFSLSSTAQFSADSDMALTTSVDVDFAALAAALNIVK